MASKSKPVDAAVKFPTPLARTARNHITSNTARELGSNRAQLKYLLY